MIGDGRASGGCFGYQVALPFPGHYLRRSGSRPLDVTVAETAPPSAAPSLIWERPRFPFAATLHLESDRIVLGIEHTGWIHVEPAVPRITLPDIPDRVRLEERLWGLPAMLCFLAAADIPLHAAAVEWDGRAVAIAAPSRHGKTTLAAAAVAAGGRLLSEDLTCVRLAPEPVVVPGPAMLRLRPDVAARLVVPGTSVVAEDDDRVHLAVDDPGAGDPIALEAVVVLGEHDGPPITATIDPAEALRLLWTVSFNLPTTEDRTRCLDQLGALVAAVPVIGLSRRRQFADLAATVDRLIGVASGRVYAEAR